MADVNAYLLDWEGGSVPQSRTWRTQLIVPTSPAGTTGASELGVDVACIDDIQPTFALAAGVPNLAMALCRRLMTPRGGLFYDPDYGLDLRDYLNAGVTDAEMETLPEEIRLELEKDERVQSAAVDFVYTRQAESLKITIVVSTSVGPFELSVSVSKLTVEMLGLRDGSLAAL